MPWGNRRRLGQLVRIDHPAHGGNAVRGHPYPPGVLPDTVLVRRQVNAVDLVFRDVAVEPLDLRPHLFKLFQGSQGELPDFAIGQASGAGYSTFNDKLRHRFQL